MRFMATVWKSLPIAALGLALALATGCNNTSGNGGGNGGGGGTTGGTTTSSGGGGGAKGNPVTGDTIPVGAYLSLTGEDADFGNQTKDGFLLAVEEINDAGGINGKKLDPKVENDESDAAKAASAVTKLITNDKAVAVVGEIASGRSLAAAPICQTNEVPMVSPSSTNVKVTQVGDYIFRVCFIDSFQAYVCAKFARETLKVKTAAIFTQTGNPYSTDFGSEFKKNFTEMGGNIVQEATYGANDTDFKGALTKMKTANPEFILIPGYYNKVGTIGKQARELGITVPLMGGDGWGLPGLFTTAGDALENCYFSDHASVENPSPEMQAFVTAFKKKYGADKKPGSLTALGYDAMKILAQAMRSAKTLDGPGIRDGLAQTKDFKGATGTITINKDRNADKPAVVMQIKGHDFKWVQDVAQK